MFRANVQKFIRECLQKVITRPAEELMFSLWQKKTSLGKWVEKAGLPRRSIEAHFQAALTLEVDPHSLNTLIAFENKYQRRSLGNRFIWDGDWDKNTRHFHDTERYRFLADIWEHRSDLTRSSRFQELTAMYRNKKPYSSYHKGVYLDTDSKVHRFLEIYLTFMKQLEQDGYNPSLAEDHIGIALDRKGHMVKINKGLHRLAMAQIVGLKKLPVCIRAVHRYWWNTNNAEPGKKPWAIPDHLTSQLFSEH